MLQGRVVIVTGASSGIGRDVARRCAAEGARVLAIGRRRENLEETAAAHDGITPHVADLLEPDAPARVAQVAVERLGALDGLVHAAGTVLRNEDPLATSDARHAELISENLELPFRMARDVAKVMVERGGGSIVLVSSQLAHVAVPGYASYSAAKGGVASLVRALASDLGPRGVRVNALAPGVVRTPLAYVDRANFDDLVDGVAARHPLRRIGEPDDLAGPAVFMLGDDSRWMTGHSLVVDGGFSIQ